MYLSVFDTLPRPLSNFFKRYPPRQIQKYSSKIVPVDDPTQNPFLPTFNPATNAYRDPVYSLRRQSDLYKMALKFDIQDMLPPIQKRFGEEKKRLKPIMRGVKYPKGTVAMRTRQDRIEKREKAIANMDEIIAKVKGNRYRRRIANKRKFPKNLF
ncbi:mitochondrial 54S ribosomal protein mL59 [Lipomyces oligophaga]|uniref:mitochondrial 54S ribosomal protein mL59 n=1 Tax=Lipomyces oligophaga TaxID=45792 RepID=UPI0034CE5583